MKLLVLFAVIALLALSISASPVPGPAVQKRHTVVTGWWPKGIKGIYKRHTVVTGWWPKGIKGIYKRGVDVALE
jgi:hypothetical protein